jgi:AcrR family transcriptional regulator
MSSSAVQTRDHILDAAATVIMREGSGSLTLERVAREAGVSKGGLLYHFAQKEQLIQALVERMLRHFDEDRRSFESEETPGADGRRTRAFVRATLEGAWARKSGLKRHGVEMFSALLAALSTDPELLEPMRRRSRQWQAELENDGLPPDRATIVRLAADGLWFAELLGLTKLAPSRRKSVVREMLRLAGAKPAGARATAVAAGGSE